MHRNIIIFTIAFVYFVLATYGLHIFETGLLGTSILLFGIPALLLSHYTRAPSAVILSVTAVGVGLSILLESIAHTFGLWYTLGENEVRLLGVVPLEMVIAFTLQIIFLALVYEVLFDDGNYTLRNARDRVAMFVLFAVAALALVLFHQLVLGNVFVEYSYLWIIGALIASSLAMLMVHKALSVQFLDRVINFALFSSVPLGISLWLATENAHKVFSSTEAYVSTVQFFGNTVPLEEMILLFAVPFFVATVYELYLDDQA